MTRPLEGLKVLELARILAGPWTGQLLADLGADVVKVESPDGDDTRGWGPPFVEAADGGDLSAAYFHATNRGKRSVTIDFRTPEGQEQVRQLAAKADILIENFKLGGLQKYGLDAQSLRALNPRLIYCSITGFGQTGPYAHRAGYDYLIQGMGGLMSLTGTPDGEPMKVGVAFVDIFTGLYAAVGVLAALRRRDETGEGATVDMSLLDCQVSVLANQALNYLVSGDVPGRLGNAHPNIVPYQVFSVADGYLIVAVGNDAQFRRFCGVIGAPELAEDAAFATNAARVENRDRLVPLLAPLVNRFNKTDLLAKLEAEKVPAGPINDLEEVFADPQVIARGLRLDLAEPDAAGGSIPSVRSPIVIDGKPMAAERASPQLGADTEALKKNQIW
ncbi:CaiB/BaiF CoA-transferase family protein [Methyloligella sp. 2.7D]|uniref:CaiB/BaiF CoA transferase family protein n=1 Tax=unclassified Methyloligella TaxID=2625955 RepID=UPI00157C81B1|nr:CaiB/BaiF CoA-transferase family protein [Methyloligella sp. GL2]QKP76953.1 CoA transferase [Methyloligella sp. GL2]